MSKFLALKSIEESQKLVIAERLVQYHRETAPVVDFYRERGLVRDIVIVGGYDVMTPVFERALDIRERTT